jgi:hypothetical protein
LSAQVRRNSFYVCSNTPLWCRHVTT